MQVFINEKSLHGQFNQYNIENAINDFLSAIKILNETSVNKTIYLCEQLFSCQAIQGSHINSILNSNYELKSLFFYNLKNAVNWSNQQSHISTSSYIYNAIDFVNSSVAEISERKIGNGCHTGFLLNFTSSSFGVLQQIQVIKDNQNNIDVACSFDERSVLVWLINWGIINPNQQYELNSSFPPRDYQTVLSNSTAFTVTQRKNQGRKVYQRNGTNELWVVDNYHIGRDAHIEVFDSVTHRHLGTSMISQVRLDTRYKVKNRML